MIKRCGFSWRTPALKWKSKLVSYQSWTERPTSSPPTQWPAPALSQCLSAGTRRGAPNKWSCEGYDRSLSSPLATFCFEAKIVNWPSSLWNQRQPLLWKTVLITSGYGSNLPSTRLSIQWINMYTNFRDHWTMANCSLSKLQICAFTVTTLLEAERLLEFHLKLASANGPRSIENLWRKATESVLLQDCKIWTHFFKEGDFWWFLPGSTYDLQCYNIPYTHTQLEHASMGQGVPRSHQISRRSLQAPHLKMLQLFFQLIGWDLKFRNLGTAVNLKELFWAETKKQQLYISTRWVDSWYFSFKKWVMKKLPVALHEFPPKIFLPKGSSVSLGFFLLSLAWNEKNGSTNRNGKRWEKEKNVDFQWFQHPNF